MFNKRLTLLPIDSLTEYNNYYHEDEDFDVDDDEDEDDGDDEIEDFEARYLKTGIDLNLNPSTTQPIQSHTSDQK